MKRTLSLALLTTLPLCALDLRLSNTNFLISDRDHTFDYNRLRLESRAELGDRLTLRATVDNEHLIGPHALIESLSAHETPLPFDPYHTTYESDRQINRLALYRLYGTYEADRATLHAGLLRVPFGIGRIWTPTDLFNPLNIHNLETEERLGVVGIHTVTHTGDFSRLELVGTLDADKKPEKFGAMFKGPYLVSHSGISLIQTADFKMAGIESERHIGTTGALGRFEGGWFFDHNAEQADTFRGLIGLDHGFVGGLTVAIEAFYDHAGRLLERDRYLGTLLGYPIDALLTLSLASMANLSDESLFVNLSSLYIGRNSDLGFGVMVFSGDRASEYGSQPTRLYLSLSHFF